MANRLKGFPQRSYFGKTHKSSNPPTYNPAAHTARRGAAPAKKPLNSFEVNYQKFIAELKAKKAAQQAELEEKQEEEKKEVIPEKVEEPAPVIPETVAPIVEEPILNEKRTTKKKKAIEEETPAPVDLSMID